ncbi:MAG: hypothetical protein PHU56_02730 [Candidatus Pacebacteria bacterium]|nr:hypothetical protein [Candidatus Paceibacterota bacterium]
MIIGHQQQWNFLKKMANGGRVPQALLFSGVDGLGKKAAAMEFIKLLNCERQEQTPCGRCFSCLNIERRRHPDLLVIEPTGKDIQIGQIRDLQRFLSYARQIAEFKATIIDNAHCLNQEAQNCLLKTLEEPRENTILFLITSLPHMLVGTILSRCEELKFYPLGNKEMAGSFGGFKDNPLWQEVLDWSDGRPGLAASFFGQNDLIEQRLANERLVDGLLKDGLAERLLLIKDYWASLAASKDKDGEEPENDDSVAAINGFLETCIFRLRRLLRQKAEHGATDRDSAVRVAEILKKTEDLKFLLLSSNINKRLLLENFVINII